MNMLVPALLLTVIAFLPQASSRTASSEQQLQDSTPAHNVTVIRPMVALEADRSRAVAFAHRWLGVELRPEQVKRIDTIIHCEESWAFPSLVTETEPAWEIECSQVVFPIDAAKGQATHPYDLTMLLRQRDGALLGLRSRWPHEGLGVRLTPLPSKELLERLSYSAECWTGIASDRAAPSLREVLTYLSKGLGNPLDADQIKVYIVDILPECNGLESLKHHSGTAPLWSVDLCTLATKDSLALGMDVQRGNAKRVVSHIRHLVAEGPFRTLTSETFMTSKVELLLEDGRVEARNYVDPTHPPPFGLRNEFADVYPLPQTPNKPTGK